MVLVFSECGEAHPAWLLRLLLLRAGDVEQNPGPSCGVCNRPIRSNNRPMQCEQCGQIAHAGCTRLTRREIQRAVTYTCGECRGEEVQPRGSGVQPEREERATCSICNQVLRRGAPAIRCLECMGEVHRACSGLRRRQEAEGWRCPRCEGGEEPEERPVVTLKNKKCPECEKVLAKSKNPLKCNQCERGYHMKCAKETRKALETLRANGTWVCHQCGEYEKDNTQVERNVAQTVLDGGETRKGMIVMQWNCDYLATKIDELKDVLKREKVDVLAVQETKLGEKDKTPRLAGYSPIRKDRKGSGTVLNRGGGLVLYIKDGIPHWEETVETHSMLEAQVVCIPLSKKKQLRVVNIYIPPYRGTQGREELEAVMADLRRMPRQEDTIWCGDFNAHHPTWDPYVEEDSRGTRIEEWMCDEGLITLNDGSGTRYSRKEGEATCSAPDLTVIRMDMVEHFSWSVLHDLQSDHLPIKISWRKTFKVEKGKRSVDWNVDKADWNKYRDYIEEHIVTVQEEEDIPQKYKKMVKIIKEAANESIPKKVIREERNLWITADILRMRRERNELRRNITTRREEWVNKCRELSEMTLEAQRRTWRKNLESIKESKDTGKAWRVVKGLGAAGGGGRRQALVYKGRRCPTAKSKANAFVQEYAEVSGKKSNKETRREEVELARELKETAGPKQEVESDFTYQELIWARNKIKNRKAAGPDDIKSDMLKRLPECAMRELLLIYNYSWREKWVPQEWRQATVTPIPKPGKNPEDIGSFRPIALTSHLGKLMERLVTTRLTWWLEATDALSPFQAGYRRGRSTVDQCLRLSQGISDGLQKKPPERTILTLFDYSKAFDTVRRVSMLAKMKRKGVPIEFVKWIKAWLVNRIAQVRVDGVMSRKRTFKEGLPQGAVLSPILFVLFIDDMLGAFEEGSFVSAFADDLAIACSSRKKEEAEAMMQREVSKVEEWSRRNGLHLNPDKCTTCLFSTDSSESKWVPTLTLHGQALKEDKNQTFLGVTYDKRLTFGQHVDQTCKKMISRTNLLRAIGGAAWGWSRGDMRQVYTATQGSLARYASPAWSPWISKTNLEKLERAQLKAGRAIAGLTMSTPREAVLLEAGLETLGETYEKAEVSKMDAWSRLSEGDPRRETAEKVVPQRTKKGDWRNKSRGKLNDLKREVEGWDEVEVEEEREPPWRSGTPCVLRKANTTKRESAQEQRQRSEEAVAESGECDYQIYTDGSATGGTERGGAGIVAYRGGEVVREWSAPAGRICSSYGAELTAMREAVNWLGGRDDWRRAVVITDSLSLVEALRGGEGGGRLGGLQKAMWQMTDQGKSLEVVWVPGHCGLAGNERADEMAKRGGEANQPEVPLDGSVRMAYIRRSLGGHGEVQHERTRETYRSGVKEDKEGVLSREERVNLSRFRSGHHTQLRRWLVMVKREEDDTCRLCGEEEESSEHLWIRCPALALVRFQHELGESMSELVESPVRAMALLRIILSRLR